MANTQERTLRRKRAHRRVRARVSGTAERPRLSVYKSSKYIYAQVIDDLPRRDPGAGQLVRAGAA